MPAKNQWTLNCLITGAQVYKLLSRNQWDAANLMLQNLSSELSAEEVNYVLKRIYDVLSPPTKLKVRGPISGKEYTLEVREA